jgi:hypothetical protein
MTSCGENQAELVVPPRGHDFLLELAAVLLAALQAGFCVG